MEGKKGQSIKSTACLLCFPFVGTLILVVNSAKIGNDDRNWKSDDEHSTQRADAPNNFPRYRPWNHVSVTGKK